MICRRCGYEFDDDALACLRCGTPVAAEMPTEDTEAQLQRQKEDEQYRKNAKKRYRGAKSEYKRARKAAGKSRAPLVIICIIVGLLLAAAGAFGTYFIMNQKLTEMKNQNTELQGKLDKIQADADKAKAEEEAAKAAAEKLRTTVIGTWGFSSFDGATINGKSDSACQSGKESGSDVSISFASFTDNKVVADITVLYHGHEANSGSGSWRSPDEVRTFKEEHGVYENGTITFTIDSAEVDTQGKTLSNGSKIVVKCTLSADFTSMTVKVSSYFESDADYVEDSYTLRK